MQQETLDVLGFEDNRQAPSNENHDLHLIKLAYSIL